MTVLFTRMDYEALPGGLVVELHDGRGVKEVWLIDRHEQTIEIVNLEGGHLADGNESAKSAVITGFQLVPTDLFSAP